MSSEKKRSPWIADEIRTMLLTRLEKLGVHTKDLGDEEIVKKMMELEKDSSERLSKAESAKAFVPMNAYASHPECKLKNKEFIEKLYNLGVPSIFLPAFEDEDIKLDNREIWKKVQKSNIRQLASVKDIFRDRSSRAFV